MSAKYPRSFHLPWSPGGTSDDKRLASVSGLLGAPLVVTEKCDGSNLTYTRHGVFARSHSGPPSHPSFDRAKATHARLAHRIPEGLSLFCEYCFAVHSIEYGALPDYSLVFGARDDEHELWWDWDRVTALARDLGLPTVPVLFRGRIGTARELETLTTALMGEPSAFGGIREGVVVRVAGEIPGASLSKSLAKCVRRDHVATDEHWMHRAVRPQLLERPGGGARRRG